MDLHSYVLKQSGKAMTIHHAPVPSHSEYEMQHTSSVNPRIHQPRPYNLLQRVSVRSIYLNWVHCCCCSIRLVHVYYSRERLLLASSYLSVHLSVRPHGTARFPLKGLSWNLIFKYFSKICRENSNFIKIGREYRVLYMKTNIHICSISLFFLKWKMFRTKVVVKIGAHILRSVTIFRKSCRLWDSGKIL
jgi:hypothetical protein